MTKNRKKNYSWKKVKNFFFSKTAIHLSLGLHKVCPSYRRSLQLSKEAIQHFKTWTFTNFFLLLWVIFALLDPGPDSESGSTGPIESGSNPDPDPKPCYTWWNGIHKKTDSRYYRDLFVPWEGGGAGCGHSAAAARGVRAGGRGTGGSLHQVPPTPFHRGPLAVTLPQNGRPATGEESLFLVVHLNS